MIRRLLLSATLVATLFARGATSANPAVAAPPFVNLEPATPAPGTGPASVTIGAITRSPIAASISAFTLAQLDASGLYRPSSADTPSAIDAINRVIGRKTRTPLELEDLKATQPDAYASLGASEAIQSTASPLIMASPVLTFYGQSSDDNVTVGEGRYIPPDTTGEVGPNHFVQAVNVNWGVFDKVTGNRILGPQKISALFAGTGTACETNNNGDPIVLYDQLADRWMISQFALPNIGSDQGPFYQCIAVSTSGDPTGTWVRYTYLFSNTLLNDYPHFGVWRDGYYATFNTFDASTNFGWGGMAVGVYERDKMLAGDLSARQVLFFLNNQPFPINWIGGGLPADIDGRTLPPVGAPNIVAAPWAFEWGVYPTDRILFFKAAVDWTNPANSALTGPVSVDTADWNSLCDSTRSCVPQLGTTAGLDAIADRFMHRMAYRNFGSYQSLVINHTVNDGANRAGVRWYEIRNPHATTPTIYQQSTYAPGDGVWRWMGSAAQDAHGNLAIGFSGSSGSQYPDIRYAGRLRDDPLSTLSQGEAILMAGGGSQTASGPYGHRWGDYSHLSVDPSDDCTFWYTTEIYRTTSERNWSTGIGSFRFPDCGTALDAGVIGVVKDISTSLPISGALVAASNGATLTLSTLSNAAGAYTLTLGAGVYTVTTTAYGYLPGTSSGITATGGVTVTANITLTPAPTYVISGFVTSEVTGSPLTATVTAVGSPYAAVVGAASSPATGYYSLTVPGGGQSWSLTAAATAYGPKTTSTGAITRNQTISFQLPTFHQYECGGTFSDGDPTYNRLVAGSPPTTISSYGTSVYYRPLRFTVGSTGPYSMVMSSNLDGFYTLYQNSFNPASPLSNALEAVDDLYAVNPAIFRTLTAGTTYVLVASTWSNGTTGVFTDTLSGYGTITATCGFSQISGNVTNISTGQPVSGALVTASNGVSVSLGAVSNAGGVYTRTVPAGVYTVTAYASGYLQRVSSGVVVTDTAPVTANNFELPIPSSRTWLPFATR